MPRLFALVLPALIFAVACTPADRAAESGADRFPAEPSGSAGYLVVDQTVGGSVYTEGAWSFIELTTAGGDLVVRKKYTDLRLTRPLLRLSLEPGTYRLSSWQRGCSGSCPAVDPPSSRCSVPFEMRPGEEFVATVELRPLSPCTVVFGERVGPELSFEQARGACLAIVGHPDHSLRYWARVVGAPSTRPVHIAWAYAEELFPDFEPFVKDGAVRGCLRGLEEARAGQ